MTQSNVVIDYNDQQNPMLLLLMNSILTQNLELQIQGGASQVLQAWAEGAAACISAGNNELQQIANEMATATGANSATEITRLNAMYNVQQTLYSNLNNQYSNVMQAGGTIVTDLTQVEQQALQLCQVTIDFQNNTNQLITQWSN